MSCYRIVCGTCGGSGWVRGGVCPECEGWHGYARTIAQGGDLDIWRVIGRQRSERNQTHATAGASNLRRFNRAIWLVSAFGLAVLAGVCAAL